MPETRYLHIILYDISDDRRRTELHKVLSRWGGALQYSVFQVRCTPRELERIRYELTCELGESDRVAVIRLCGSCAQRIAFHGEPLDRFETEQPCCRIV